MEIQSSVDLLDHLVFMVGFTSFQKWLDTQDPEKGGEMSIPEDALRAAAAHEEDGLLLLRLMQPEVERAYRGFLEAPAIMSKSKTDYERSLKGKKGKGELPLSETVAKKVTFLKKWLPKLKAKPTVLEDTFPGDAKQIVLLFCNAVSEKNPVSRIKKVSGLRPLGSWRKGSSWMKRAARLAGVPVDPATETEIDSAIGKAKAKELKQVKNEIAVSDPMTAQAADLETRKEDLLEEINETIEESSAPQAVTAAVASVTTADPYDYVSRIGREKLSPAQEVAMLVRGKSIIAAGAGSGKTRVLASKVVYTIQELGVSPAQIIATSFSNKSAAELKKRIQEYGGEGILDGQGLDDGMGTTHSVGGRLIRRFADDVRRNAGAFKGGKKILALFKTKILENKDVTNLVSIAMKQLEMGANPDNEWEDPPDAPPPTSFWPGVGEYRRGGEEVEVELPEWEPSPEEYAGLYPEEPPEPEYEAPPLFEPEPELPEFPEPVFEPEPELPVFEPEPELPEISPAEQLADAPISGQVLSALLAEIELHKDLGDKQAMRDFYTTKNLIADWEKWGERLKPYRVELFQQLLAKYQPDLVLARLRELFVAARNNRDRETMNIVTELGKQYKDTGSIPPDAIGRVQRLFGQYRVASSVQRQLRANWFGRPVTADYKEEMLAKIESIPGWEKDRYYSSFHDQVSRGRKLKPNQIRNIEIGIQKAQGKGDWRGQEQERDVWYYEKNPAGQWFNRHMSPQTPGKGSKPISTRQVKTALSKFKANLSTPSQAWDEATKQEQELLQSLEGLPEELLADAIASVQQQVYEIKYLSAAYGAYEWLKGNVSDFKGKRDHDDTLIMTSQLLIGDEQALAQARCRFKYIFVDEAQDLNKAQHLMFGLIAGYYDPKTQQPYEDGRISADTYTFIGDDKQAIYEFRGAVPEHFVNMSDLTEGGQGFETKILEMNYRSGEAIVEAANKLIQHNMPHQIPMVCRANPERSGAGSIRKVHVASHQEGAALFAEQVQEECQGENALYGYNDFGVALRTNAEAQAFGLECLKRGIPFRCKINFFQDRTTQALIQWMNIAKVGLHGDRGTLNDAILKAHKNPKFYLGTEFDRRVESLGRGKNYLEWLLEGGWEKIYNRKKTRWMNEARVLPYVEEVERVAEMGSEADPVTIMNEVLQTTGFSKGGERITFLESLIAELKKDDEVVDLLEKEYEGKDIPDDAWLNLAMAPLEPFKGLLESYEDVGPAMDYVMQLSRANEKLGKRDDVEAEDYKEPAVEIGTVHNWKGLEVKHLFTSMPRNVFPHAQSTSPEEIRSERRLAYVALTRGQESVTVLAPEVDHRGKPAGESRFISEACIPGGDDLVEGEETSEGVEVGPMTPDEVEETMAKLGAYDVPTELWEPRYHSDHETNLREAWGDLYYEE